MALPSPRHLRAANHYRTAGIFLMATPVDGRFRSSSAKQTDTVRKGAALLDPPPDIVEVPHQETSLPGYFFQAAVDGAPRPTVILTNGYDGMVEEMYFANAAAALQRGYHVLAFDGPGQGSVILGQEIGFRPDWENVVTPVVDFAITLPGVDSTKLVLHGWSFGGRNLWVHAISMPIDYFRIAPEYTLKGPEQLIRCPTFVCATEGDDLSVNTGKLADELVCPMEYLLFAAHDDVSGHCEMSARSLFHQRVYDWLDGVLELTPTAREREGG